MKVIIGKPSRRKLKQKVKVKVKIHDYDTWNVDTTLAYIIAPMLKQLKDTTHSAPPVDLKDVPSHLWPTMFDQETGVIKNDGDINLYFDRWDWILEEMIFAFESKIGDFEDQFFTEEGYDQKAHEIEQKRVENGFKLFGKYYESLWD